MRELCQRVHGWFSYHYLAVFHWSPKFILPKAKIERTLVWVWFLGLNIVYCDESFLLANTMLVWKLIKVVTTTLNMEKGWFSCICVEMDMNELVVGRCGWMDIGTKLFMNGIISYIIQGITSFTRNQRCKSLWIRLRQLKSMKIQ